MTSQELQEIADQRMSDPNVLGRLVCNLRSNDLPTQRHHDDRSYSILWENDGDFWRCTIFTDGDSTHRLAQVDLHENSTVRADLFEPGRITISPDESILCLTRYKPR